MWPVGLLLCPGQQPPDPNNQGSCCHPDLLAAGRRGRSNLADILHTVCKLLSFAESMLCCLLQRSCTETHLSVLFTLPALSQLK